MKITNVSFSLTALSDYQYWQKQDRKTLKAINKLIDDIVRHPFTGIGKPEPLKFQLDNCWSRRINKTDRLVYSVSEDTVWLIQCRYHY